jgi:hypothetical protein
MVVRRKGLRKARHRVEKEMDKLAINRTVMRQARIEAMQRVTEQTHFPPVISFLLDVRHSCLFSRVCRLC